MSGGSMRIGDVERERAAVELGEHFAMGRIDDEEHGERLDAVWSSRTQADLDVLFFDLPPSRPTPPVAPPGHGRRGRTATRFGHRPRWTGALVPLLVVLGVLTVLTHIPFVLLALGIAVFVWSRANRRRHQRYDAWSGPSSPVR